VDLFGEEDGKKDLDVPSDAPTEYVEEDREEVVASTTVDDVVTIIQAGFRGMQLRRGITGAAQDEEDIEEISTDAIVADE